MGAGKTWPCDLSHPPFFKEALNNIPPDSNHGLPPPFPPPLRQARVQSLIVITIVIVFIVFIVTHTIIITIEQGERGGRERG